MLEAALVAEREQSEVLRRQTDKAQSANARLLEELDASAKYAAGLKQQLELLTRRAGDAEAKVAELSATTAAASRTRDELAATRARADAAVAAAADAQARAAHSESRVESYRTRLHDCKARLRASLHAQDDLAADNASLKSQTLSMLDTLRTQFLDVLTNWSEHISSLQQSEQRKNEQIATLQRTMQDYAREMEGTKIRIQQMHSNECEQAEHSKRRRQAAERRNNNEDAETNSVLREASSRLGDSQPRPAPAPSAAPSHSSSYSALRHPSASASALSPRSDTSSSHAGHDRSTSSSSAARSHAVDLLAQAEREAAEHARERMQRELRRSREQEEAREQRDREQQAAARRKREQQEAEEEQYRRSRAAIRERAQGPSSCSGRSRCRSSERVSFAGSDADSPPSPCCCAHRCGSRSRSRGRSASRPRSSVPVGSLVGRAPPATRGGRSRSRSCGRGVGGRGRSRTLSPPRHYPAFLASAHSSYLHTHASSQKKRCDLGPGAPACATVSGAGGIGVLPSTFPERPCSGVAKHAPRAYLDAPSHSPRAASGSRSFATGASSGHSKVAQLYSYSSSGDALTSGLSSSRKRPIQDGTWQVTGVNTCRTDVIAGGRPSGWSGRSDEAKPTRTVTPPQHVSQNKLKAGTADVPTAGVRTIIDELLGSPRSA